MKTLLFLCFISFAPALLAQNSALDSLKKEMLNSAKDTAKLTRLKLQSAILLYKQGEFDACLKLLNEATTLAKLKSDKSALTKAYTNFGNVYADQGNNPLALKYYQDALETADQLGDKQSMAHLYKNIGVLYISWKRLDEALAYYEKAEKTGLLIGDSSLVADCYNNKGTVYEQQHNYPAAQAVYKKALSYYEKMKYSAGIAMTLSNIAIVYKYQKDYTTAIAYNTRSLELSTQLGDKWMMAATMNNIGNVYGEKKNLKAAIDFCTRSLNLAKEINAAEIIIANYETMAAASAAVGDYGKAYEYQQQYAKEKDHFINTESTRQLSELQVKYETQKKQRENERLQYENQLKTAAKNKAERDKLFTIYIAVISFVTLAIILFLVYRNRNIKARAAEKQHLNNAIFDTEQNERIRIARDLHDSIGQMLSVVKMHLSSLHYEAPEDKNIITTMGLVDKTVKEVRTISHNLLPEELNSGLLNALERMCNKIELPNGPEVVFDASDEIWNIHFAKPLELSLYRIAQEVLGNMLKHADAKMIELQISSQSGNIHLALTDDGKGFDADGIQHSDGIGWKNIMTRAQLLNGKMQVQSVKNAGTRVEIIVPC